MRLALSICFFLLAAAVAVGSTVSPSPTPPGCVGTIAGLPLHSATDGALALNAAVAATYPAVAVPGTIDNIVIPGVESAVRVDGSFTLSVMAGGGTDATSTSALATSVAFVSRAIMAISTPTSLHFGDYAAIRRYDLTTGQLDVVAGVPNVNYLNSPDGVLAAGAYMVPVTLAVDAATGDILISDVLMSTYDYATGQFGQLLRLIPAAGPHAGRIVTVAGTGAYTHSTDGVLALETGYAGMYDATFASNGDYLITEFNYADAPSIVRISRADNRSRIIAGSATDSVFTCGSCNDGYFPSGSPAVGTVLAGAYNVAEVAGTVYFTDGSRLISIPPPGTLMYVLAGVPPSKAGATIYGALASAATFKPILGVRPGFSPDNLLLTETTGSVYRYDLATGRQYAIAGPVQYAQVTAETTQGLIATKVSLPAPDEITVDPSTGDVFVASGISNVVMRVHARDGTVSVIAGSGSLGCSGNVSDAKLASMSNPGSVALDGRGGLFIADQGCCVMRRLDLSTGAMVVVAGNATSGCSSAPLPVASDVAPNVAQVALRTPLAPPSRIVIDTTTGDVYWTEKTGLRVVVLRAGGSRGLFRIAGNGASGGVYGSTVVSGVKALNTALSGPSTITLDPSGAPVFVDGIVVQVSPGTIMRLTPNGTLDVLVRCGVVGAFDLIYRDGPFVSATGREFAALAFIGELLYIADNVASASPPVWAAVRTANLTAGTLATFAGSQDGVLGDGFPKLKARFLSISSFALFPGGDLVVADRAASVLRVIMNDEATTSTFCPAGYVCTCGTPIPCTDPAFFCPANQLRAANVSRGYYAIADNSTTRFEVAATGALATSAVKRYVAQAACPIGSYCAGGVRSPCPAGTYGLSFFQTLPSGCLSCPVGTFSAVAGAIGSDSCLACPAGTYASAPGSAFCSMCDASTSSARPGANASSACSPCPEGTAALPGSGACVALGSARMLNVGPVATVSNIVAPVSAKRDATALLAGLCVSIGILAAIPLAAVLFSNIAKRGNGSGSGISNLLRVALLKVDMYALHHRTPDGTHPFFLRTSRGGAITLLACGTILIIAVILIVDYEYSNSLLTTSLLPAALPTLQQLATLPAHDAVNALPAIAPASISRGFELRVTAFGPPCGAPSLDVASLLGGAFKPRVTSGNSTSASFVHSFACPDCAFGPLSSVRVTFPPACQAFLITAVSVGATGSVSVASVVATNPSPVAGESAESLSKVYVALRPEFEVVEDTQRGVNERGYSVSAAVSGVTQDTAVTPTSVILGIDLSVSDVYVLVSIVPIIHETQLLSSIIGLAGLLGGFGVIFRLFERFRDTDRVRATRRHVTSQLGAMRSVALRDSSIRKKKRTSQSGLESSLRSPGDSNVPPPSPRSLELDFIPRQDSEGFPRQDSDGVSRQGSEGVPRQDSEGGQAAASPAAETADSSTGAATPLFSPAHTDAPAAQPATTSSAAAVAVPPATGSSDASGDAVIAMPPADANAGAGPTHP